MKRFLLAYLALVALAWGWALPLPGPGATPLSAWAVREHALTLTGLWAFGMLLSVVSAVGLVLLVCYLVDRRLYPPAGLGHWLKLRFRLSTVAALCCFIGAAAL